MSPTKRKGADLHSAVRRALGRATATDDLHPSITIPSEEEFERVSADARKLADELLKADDKLKTVHDEVELDYLKQILQMEHEEKQVLDRLSKIGEKKLKAASDYANKDATDEDILEINAGGKIITTRRCTLTQLKGTRLEALFSGRWDKRLLRDRSGRVLLDVNGDCFQAIMVFLNDLTTSCDDRMPGPPSVYSELNNMLKHQLELFEIITPPLMDSNIITRLSHANILYDWLVDDGSEGGLNLLYRSSKDGQSMMDFHWRCDNKGPTLILIETVEGGVLGGYTNTSWQSHNGKYAYGDKAFLFALSGFELSSPCKMKLKNGSSCKSTYHNRKYGPVFGYGYDLRVDASGVRLNIGDTYEQGPAGLSSTNAATCYQIKEMEVYQVVDDCQHQKHMGPPSYSPATNRFSKEVNEAIVERWKSLHALGVKVSSLEESFKDEEHFIESLATGNTRTMMATKRATLMVTEDSVLAQQFDDTKWTVQGSFPPVKAWTPDEVSNWVKDTKGIPDDVGSIFRENKINGSELLALDKEGLKMLEVKRVGTICLLSDEISLLKKAANDDKVTHIEHSPYCFGKILDHLRLKKLHSVNLSDEPSPPTVCESQKKSFEKVVDYYFQGESSKFILG
mmetsp:Transcript_19222/g.32423  ORF Transcript_19222/g.32423 Transcript_19222/m.32423 type:complete len:625 (-) Transcript_19222:162-2036(-)